MTIYLSSDQIIFIYVRIVQKFGGMYGIRDKGLIDAAAARPEVTFGGADLYPDLCSKAAALGHSLLANHPFLDGNKRTAFACMDLFLQENGLRIAADDDASEAVLLKVIQKKIDDKDLASWLRHHTKPFAKEK